MRKTELKQCGRCSWLDGNNEIKATIRFKYLIKTRIFIESISGGFRIYLFFFCFTTYPQCIIVFHIIPYNKYYYPPYNLQLLNIVFNLVMYITCIMYICTSDTCISHKNDWYPCLVGFFVFFFFFGTDTTKSGSSAKSSLLLFFVCTGML